jgi:hypothetical protein
MLANFLGVLPNLTPPLCALAFKDIFKDILSNFLKYTNYLGKRERAALCSPFFFFFLLNVAFIERV